MSLLVYHVNSELDDWLRCINAHIHIAYLTETETPLAEDYWDVGTVARSLWKVPLRYE